MSPERITAPFAPISCRDAPPARALAEHRAPVPQCSRHAARAATGGARSIAPGCFRRNLLRGAWRLVALAALAGCTTLPGSKTVSYHEHRIQRDEAVSQKIEEKRDHAEFLLAHQRWVQQDYQGCREQLEALLARNPKHCDARLLLADVLMSTRQPQEALAQVQEALKYHADNADVQYAMGLTLDLNGRSEEAVACYERASRAMPTNEAYALSYRTAQEAAARRKNPAASAAAASLAVGDRGWRVSDFALPPVQTEASATKAPAASAAEESVYGFAATLPGVATAGVCAEQMPGRGFAQAGAESSPLVSTAVSTQAINPPEPGGPAGKDRSAELLASGQSALQEECPQLAALCFRRAIECNPQNPQIPLSAAAFALKHREAKMAVEILAPAAKAFPDSAPVFRCLGLAHLRNGDLAAAQKDLEKSLLLDKSCALSYFLMACTLTKLGHLEAADANFRQAEAIDPRYVVRH
jgi:Tfp pilus assembly protein PilF